MEERQRIVVIGGPTASGKSALAVELARDFGGEIVNADSMQVYRGMDVGTAKPSPRQRAEVPHHLIDVVDPDEDFNAALYRSLALPILGDLTARGKVGFVVGGTGLYIQALLGGLLPCPPVDGEFRRRLHQDLEMQGTVALHEKLKDLDPESAERIHAHDRVRILRALEVIHLTKGRLSSMIRNHGFRERTFQAFKICLQMERKELYHRIDERCIRMVEEGLVAETKGLLEKGYSPGLKPMKSLGYRHMIRVLKGEWDLETAIVQLQTDTRRYAKRQLTWFRADPGVVWFRPDEAEEIRERIRSFLSGAKSKRESP
ncbi:MAG: tRNA (adenosine(37)-N6)-dimethylallyltransferase MiaA [Deltaproteobacteria bacterium]|nr:tRNA (adenosine(37)-N6)-dimethylallyltransferase MiaA [Deltaproteobacteria bacterium]